jgi:hypothetical protein
VRNEKREMKRIVFLFCTLLLSLHINAQVVQESGVTIEYKITENHLDVIVAIEGLRKPYEIHIFVDDKVSYEANPRIGIIGAVATDYYYANGYKGIIYYIRTNTVKEICEVLMADIKDPKKSSAIRNKSTVIINFIKEFLLEALQTGKITVQFGD